MAGCVFHTSLLCDAVKELHTSTHEGIDRARHTKAQPYGVGAKSEVFPNAMRSGAKAF